MEHEIVTAEELERMTPSEQDALFAASVADDLEGVPAEFVQRVRARALDRIARA